jgi:tRNA (guanine-N7-)-methyltransferase
MENHFLNSSTQRGRKLSATKKLLLEQQLPLFKIDVENVDFARYTKINLEIGCGKGEFITNVAQIIPEELFIACELYMNGVAILLHNIINNQLNNIKIFPEDGRVLLQKLPDHLISNLFILFPDPWPKVKHHKRRLINKEFLSLITKKMQKNSKVYLATDHQDYAEWIKEQFSLDKRFRQNTTFDVTKSKYLNNIETKYQSKALSKKIVPHFFEYTII